jgi:hypothetical protein
MHTQQKYLRGLFYFCLALFFKDIKTDDQEAVTVKIMKKPFARAYKRLKQVRLEGDNQLHLHEVAASFRPKTQVGRWFLQQSLERPLAIDGTNHSARRNKAILFNRKYNIQLLSSDSQLRKKMTDLLQQAEQSEEGISKLFTEEAYGIAPFVKPTLYLKSSTGFVKECYKSMLRYLQSQRVYWVWGGASLLDVLIAPKDFKTRVSAYRYAVEHACTRQEKMYGSLVAGLSIALSIILLAHGIHSTYNNFKNSYEQRRRLAHVRNFIETAEKIQALTERRGLETQFKLSDTQRQRTKGFIRRLKKHTSLDSILFNTCAVNALYHEFYGNYEHALRGYTTVIAEADACCSIATTMEQENKEEVETKHKHQTQHKSWCIAKQTQATSPHIVATNFYNVLVPTTPVRNSVDFQENICLTGPNASGKSVLLRALTHNLISSQTWGFATGSFFVHTPFDSIILDFSKSDNVAEGLSLYRTEVAKYLVIAKYLQEARARNKKVLILTDEPLIGTAAKEGSELAYEIFRSIGIHFPNAMVLCSTHYANLTNLAHDRQNAWKNYKMDEPVTTPPTGGLVYPYTISPGINMRHIGYSMPEAQEVLTLLSNSGEEDESASEEDDASDDEDESDSEEENVT